MKAYRAYATGCGVTESNPRAAAAKFFTTFPTKRKCTVVQGEIDNGFFVVKYGRQSTGNWPDQWKDVTKKQVETLPENA